MLNRACFFTLALCLPSTLAQAQGFSDTTCILPQSEWRDGVPNSFLVGEDSHDGGAIIAMGYPNGGGASVRAPAFAMDGALLQIVWTETLRGITPEEMPAGSLAGLDLRVDLAAMAMDARLTLFNAPDIGPLRFTCQPR